MELLTKASFSDEVSERERKNRDVAYRAACESIVLLKNDGALPLTDKKLAVFGPGVSHTIKGGTGSGEVNERHSVTILEGLKDRGFEIASGKWLDDYEDDYNEKFAAFREGRKGRIDLKDISGSVNKLFVSFRMPSGRAVDITDIRESGTGNCLYVISRQAGEGSDRKPEKGDYCLTDAEINDIRFLAANYARFVLAINCGSSIDMTFADEIEGINAILYISQLGTEGGHAVADVLSGKVSPSGKLSDTWARTYADLPFHDEYSSLSGNPDKTFYKEGIYVGYRYFDSFGKTPLFPFGYGLSYTEFSISPAEVTVKGTAAEARITVQNVGTRYSGKETVQLYVSAPQGKLAKEYQRLAAFEKTASLAPGEKEEVTLRFDLADAASYQEENAAFVLDKGHYILRIGTSSRDTLPAAALFLPEDVQLSRHQHVCPSNQVPEELASSLTDEDVSGLTVINVDPAAFDTVTYTYETPEPCADEAVRSFVDQLTVKEMTELVVGAGLFGGESRFNMPGSVGNTTSKFWDRGLVNIALCDGPAGLRIQKVSTVDRKGRVRSVEMVISAMEALPGFIKKKMLGDPKADTPIYQFTTAFPVAAALAQTWNKGLLYEVGRAVFEEMKEYGCTYWLAPAVNIHKNPLCGRNFEYFSEDPFLAGTLASAMVRGVQQEPGYYVTVKHLACNSQEDNRNKADSVLSERTLREIYLRAFEICVKKGAAKGIMTSYNKVNGVYAPTSYDLCTKILRNEWGFDGVVMTDWFSTVVVSGNSALAIKAGNDLIMPGEPMSKRAIIKAVKKGAVAKEDLYRCCCNVVKAIMESATQKEYM